MPNLSANTLFHFTRKEFLLKIFTDGFLPRYSKEFDPLLNDSYLIGGGHVYIPMVSFCDIPMSMVKKHIEVYNSYGIGLKKDWGIEKRLNPVFYIQRKSSILENLLTGIDEYMFQNLEFQEGLISYNNEKTLEHLLDMYSYLKPYICGGNYRDRYERYKYYDEKEWRYIPAIPHTKKILRRSYEDLSREELNTLNNDITSYSLDFTANNINYIIIRDKKEVDEITDVLRTNNQYTSDDIDYIRTTFILEERILEDF